MKHAPALLGLVVVSACARVEPGERGPVAAGASAAAGSPVTDSATHPARGPVSPPATAAPTAGPAPGPVSPVPAPSPGLRVVVATPSGTLCVLAPGSGELRSQIGTGGVAGAVDVLAARSDPGGLVTIEPGEQEPGQIGHYRLAGDTLTLDGTEPFDALDGRLLWAGSLVAGAAIAEGSLLFARSGPESGGGAWPLMTSMAAAPLPDGGLRVVTVGPGPAGIERREGLLSPAGLAPLPAARQLIPGACAAVFEAKEGPAMASSDGQTVRVERPGREALVHEAPGACVEAAIEAGEASVILTGPVPTLWWLEDKKASSIVLGDAGLDAPWMPRRLAHDPGRQRVWAIVGAHLLAIDHADEGLQLAVAEAGCPASGVTLVDGG